jgi:16S rRNA (cytosine1402-N4)-methyltransferase
MDEQTGESKEENAPAHKRRARYKGTHPHTFAEKYKELNPDQYREDVEHVISRGDTPAGTHRSICVQEILEILSPKPGEIAVDCTLGYGGHAKEILKAILPGGKLFGLDADPIEIVKTEERFRAEGFSSHEFAARHINFAGIPKLLEENNIAGFDLALADLGVSSMQIDNPERGFTFKKNGPLDMRMNPAKGASAALLLERIGEKNLAAVLKENADEPAALEIARVIALRRGEIKTTRDLANAVKQALAPKHKSDEDITKAIRRTFQAIRIEVNGEFSALDALLARLPECMNSGGRIAILTFHSGEDRRVNGSFMEGLGAGLYASISETAIFPSAQEKYSNPRASSARLRWAIKK